MRTSIHRLALIALPTSLISLEAAYALPGVGPELEVTSPIYQEGLGGPASTAFGDGVFLSAWIRERHLVVARTRGSDGVLLDPGGILLVDDIDVSSEPALVYLPVTNNFLAMYSDGAASLLRGVLIEPATGNPLGSPFLVSSGPDVEPRIAVGTSELLVAYRRTTSNELLTRRFSFDGQALDPTEQIVAGPTAGAFDVAYGGGEYVVSWSSAGDLFAQRLSSLDASLLGVQVTVAQGAAAQDLVGLGSDGVDFAILWGEGGIPAATVFGRVLSSGTGDTSVASELAYDLGAAGALRFDGSGTFWFTYCAGPNYVPRVRRFGVDLTPIDPPGGAGTDLSAQPLCEYPDAAVGLGQLRATWGSRSPGFYSLRGQRLDLGTLALASSSDDQISTTAVWQNRPAVAFGGQQYLAAWNESRSGPYGTIPTDLYFTRLSAIGEAKDGTGVLLALAVEGNRPGPPAVASNGDSFLVVWNDDEGIKATRISADGMVLDTPSLSFGAGGFGPEVAYADGAYLVLWRAGASGYARRLDPLTGALLGNSDLPLPGPIFGVGCSLTTCLIVAQQLGWRMRMSDGFVLDPVPIALAGPLSVAQSAVASDGNDFLVVWSHSPGSTGYDLVGQRVNAAGVPMDVLPFEVAAAAADQARPELSFRGETYLATWSDGRAIGNDAPEIYGTRISTSAVVLDGLGAGGALLTDTEHSDPIAFAPTAAEGGERAIVVYGVRRSSSAVPNPRVAARFLGCSTGSDCASGHCVDGVCCNTSCGGGAPDDCQACSLAAGASQSGVCEVLACGQDAGPVEDAELPADDGAVALDGTSGDAAMPVDAGPNDDVGSSTDLGPSADLGLGRDAGLPSGDASAEGEESSGGCGCRAHPAPGEAAAWLGLWLFVGATVRTVRRRT